MREFEEETGYMVKNINKKIPSFYGKQKYIHMYKIEAI